MRLKSKLSQGFSLIELIVAIGVAALILPAIAAIYTFALTSSGQGDKYSKANAIAQKNMEEVYNLKKTWVWGSVLNTGAQYYQRRSGSTCDNSLNLNMASKYNEADLCKDPDGFISTIQIFPVTRVSPGGPMGGTTDDPETKKIVSKVTWSLKSNNDESVIFESYVTKH